MTMRLEGNRRRFLAAALLTGALLVGGAGTAAADGSYPTPGDPTYPTPNHYGSTYPTPSGGGGGGGGEAPAPPVLPRTGSSEWPLAAAGLGALAVGGGLVVVAKRKGVLAA